MRMIGVYHGKYPDAIREVLDAPITVKGSMVLAAEGAVSEGALLAWASGRLRNGRELKKRLGLRRDACAARVALAAYRAWGEDYAARLEGPVSTAVMDQCEDKLILTRDRMGERRLFFAARGDRTAFSEHPEPLLSCGMAAAEVNADGLRELFGLGPARTPGATPYRGIRELEPGCALVVCGCVLRHIRYFSLEARPHEDSPEATVESVRELLERAIDEVAPLRPSAMLSGGLDSTVLTALLRRRVSRLRTFCVRYEGDGEDFEASEFRPSLDEPFARRAAAALDTRHMFVTISQYALADALGDACEARGFPGMADVDSSLLLFCREIAPFSREVVSGECGDEVFGGYPWFRDAFAPPEGAFPWSGSMALRQAILAPELRGILELAEFAEDTLRDAEAAVPALSGDTPMDARLRAMQHLCFRFFMPNLQERALRMSERAGVCVHTPYADDRLAQYLYNVPWAMKRMDGAEKGLLRAAARDLLPPELLARKKSPYPKTSSSAYAEIIRLRIRAILTDPASPLLPLIDRDAVERLASSPLSPGEAPWFGQLMAGAQLLAYLIQIDGWLRRGGVRINI